MEELKERVNQVVSDSRKKSKINEDKDKETCKKCLISYKQRKVRVENRVKSCKWM